MVLNWDRLYKSCGSVCGEDKIRGYLTIVLIIEGSLAASPQCSRRASPGGSLGLRSTFQEGAPLGIRFPEWVGLFFTEWVM